MNQLTSQQSTEDREPKALQLASPCWRGLRGSVDGHDDDRGVVLERLAPAVGHGLLDRHRGGGGGGASARSSARSEAVDAESAAALDAPSMMPSVTRMSRSPESSCRWPVVKRGSGRAAPSGWVLGPSSSVQVAVGVDSRRAGGRS